VNLVEEKSNDICNFNIDGTVVSFADDMCLLLSSLDDIVIYTLVIQILYSQPPVIAKT